MSDWDRAGDGEGIVSRIHPGIAVRLPKRRPQRGGVAGLAVFISGGDVTDEFSDVIDGGDPESSSPVYDGGSV